MPPQQPDRLLDLFDKTFDFGAHGFGRFQDMLLRDVAAQAAKRNR